MAQATLRTERLLLVPLSDAHVELEVELDADPEVMRYLGAPHTRAQVLDLHRSRLAAAGMRHTRSFVLPFDEPLPGAEHGEVEHEITREQWLARERHHSGCTGRDSPLPPSHRTGTSQGTHRPS